MTKKAMDSCSLNVEAAPSPSAAVAEPPSSLTTMTNAGLRIIPRAWEAEVGRLVADDEWWMQEQLDGRHVAVHKRGDTVVAVGSAGLPVRLPPPVVDAVEAIAATSCLLKGVLAIGGGSDGGSSSDGGAGGVDGGGGGGAVFHAFDLLEWEGADLRARPYALRYEGAMDLVDAVPSDRLRFVETASSTRAKHALLARLLRDGRRGVVFKRRRAPHAPQVSDFRVAFHDAEGNHDVAAHAATHTATHTAPIGAARVPFTVGR